MAGVAGDVGGVASGEHLRALLPCAPQVVRLCCCHEAGWAEGLAASNSFPGWKTLGWLGAGPGDAEEHQDLHSGLAGGLIPLVMAVAR